MISILIYVVVLVILEFGCHEFDSSSNLIFVNNHLQEYFIGVQHLGAQGTIDLLRVFDDILG